MTGRHEVVRPFVMTGGRTRAERRDLRVETILVTVGHPMTDGLTPEQVRLVELCKNPMSVAEVGAALRLVVGVVIILAADLVIDGLVEVHQTDPVEVELDVLSRMIEKVKSL